MATVGFSGLGAVSGRTMDQLKNIGRQNTPPWDESGFPEGKHRRYGATHGLRLILVEALTEQGVTIAAAAEAVNFHGSAIERFLDAVEERQDPPALFVGHLRWQFESDGRTKWDSKGYSLSTIEGITEAVGAVLASIGTVSTFGSGRRERRISGPHLAVASIGESYRQLEARAKAAGYSINGRGIFKAVADTSED